MIGEKIHSYEIIAHLGKGGMGNVFKATDTMLGREVALKMLHPQLTVQPQFLERFKKEARVLAQLLHPNIAVIYNFIEQGDNHFMVMEYVEGTNLDEFLKTHRSLPVEFIVPVFIQVLEGLQHAHKKNIFHRDIKPANIMLTRDETVKLMDFGIAKVAGEQKMTQVNKIVGTVEFMAPELIQGKDATAASDIYATGVTLYELVSGKLPFEADTDFSLMQSILKQKIIQPHKLNEAVPRALSEIIMKALDKNPAARYADARAFQQALMSAFPGYRTINMTSLKPVSPFILTEQPGPATGPSIATMASMETRAEIPASDQPAIDKIKQHVLKNKKIYLAAAAILFFLVLSVGLIKNNWSEKIPEKTSDVISGPENRPVERNPVEEVANQPEPIPERVILQKPDNTAKTEKVNEPKKKPVKEEENRSENKDPADTKPVNNFVENKNEEEKPADKKEVFIGTKVEFELYLQNDLGTAPERTEIPVTFSARNPVVYRGVTIINQGATAKGVIKLGKVQTDVDIFSITAANGEQIRLKALRGHGRRNEITSKRNYTAVILPGIRLQF